MAAVVRREDLAIIESCIRGHHVYRARWTPVLGEQLQCHREIDNNRDRYAVAVRKDTLTVGHLPKRISELAWYFLRIGGSITCEVSGRRCYSYDLPQGGVEVPCLLKCSGEKDDVSKLKKLIKLADESSSDTSGSKPTRTV